MILTEERRPQLLSRSRVSKKEKEDNRTRYEKRVKSKISSNVRNYNSINMNSLFKEGILTVDIEVQGETNKYTVTVSFGGFLDQLKDQLERSKKEEVTLKDIIRALINSFNDDDVYVRCSCPDYRYRLSYWNTKDKVNIGAPENIPSNITNPNNDLGPGCKHIMLVLSNHNWILKVASTINNYIHYMEKHYERLYDDVIYPAIYGHRREEITIDDTELVTDKPTLDIANIEGSTRGRFSKTYQPSRNPSIRKIRGEDEEVNEE